MSKYVKVAGVLTAVATSAGVGYGAYNLSSVPAIAVVVGSGTLLAVLGVYAVVSTLQSKLEQRLASENDGQSTETTTLNGSHRSMKASGIFSFSWRSSDPVDIPERQSVKAWEDPQARSFTSPRTSPRN